MPLSLVFNTEVIQDCLEIILHQQTGITEVTGESIPFFQAAIIEHLVPVIDDKWDNPESKAFLKKDQPSNTPVAVLKRMDALKLNVKIQQIVKRLWLI